MLKQVLDATYTTLPMNKQDDMKANIKRSKEYLKAYTEPTTDVSACTFGCILQTSCKAHRMFIAFSRVVTWLSEGQAWQ